MVAKQAQLHVMTNNPTKYKHIPSYVLRGDTYTRSYYATLCMK